VREKARGEREGSDPNGSHTARPGASAEPTTVTSSLMTGRASQERYLIERTLGRGGMATVYLAYDQTLDRHVALKVLAEHFAADPAMHDRFLREARLAAKLVHTNVVQVYDVGEDARGAYIVMEYVEGDTLADELRRRGRLPAAEVVSVGIQLCAALEAAHAEQLVHRDIKPQNILRRTNGQVKLADFGIARSLNGTQHTELGTVLGTVAYLAPEQARGEPVTAAADIYALGIVLYELLTGETPFSADTLPELLLKREQGAVTPPSELAADIPPRLEAVVMRCLALAPEYRPASAALLAQELAGSIDERVTEPLPKATGLRATEILPANAATVPLLHASPTLRARLPRVGRRRLPAAALIATLLVLALILAVAYADSGGNRKPTATTTQIKPAAASTTATRPATTTTTTTTASPPVALAALIRDVASGESAGTVDPGSGQAISKQAEQAITDEAAGKPNQAANDLQQAAMQIANGLQNGKTTSAESAKLQSDLTALAATLGLSAAATLPSQPAPNPGHPNPPAHGHGHGHGHG
jgi:serine/threonine protein kinase